MFTVTSPKQGLLFVLDPYVRKVETPKRVAAKTYRSKADSVATPPVALPQQLVLDLVQRAVAKLVRPIVGKYALDECIPGGYDLRDERGNLQVSKASPSRKKQEKVWFESKHQAEDGAEASTHKWTAEEVHFLRICLFWESWEELSLSNNEREKWDVLKWMFKPALRRFWVYGKPVVQWHENDEPFSFRNGCKAVGMDEEIRRDGLRRNIEPEIIEAVERVCAL